MTISLSGNRLTTVPSTRHPRSGYSPHPYYCSCLVLSCVPVPHIARLPVSSHPHIIRIIIPGYSLSTSRLSLSLLSFPSFLRYALHFIAISLAYLSHPFPPTSESFRPIVSMPDYFSSHSSIDSAFVSSQVMPQASPLLSHLPSQKTR